MNARKFLLPTEQESEIARQATAKMIPFVQERATATLHLNGASRAESVELSDRVLVSLKEILEAIAAGHGVTIVPQHAELTTMEAADILNVSRPYLIKLLDKGEIPYHKVGSHRRIRRDDLMEYKEELRRQREAILTQMVEEAQEMGLYD